MSKSDKLNNPGAAASQSECAYKTLDFEHRFIDDRVQVRFLSFEEKCSGRRERARTVDLCRVEATLYQLSYAPIWIVKNPNCLGRQSYANWDSRRKRLSGDVNTLLDPTG